MAAKREKKSITFLFMQGSCNNKADHNSIFCQRLQKAVEGREITNNSGQISRTKNFDCLDIPSPTMNFKNFSLISLTAALNSFYQ